MAFEIVKMGQNLHTNMEGFRRAGHIYIGAMKSITRGPAVYLLACSFKHTFDK